MGQSRGAGVARALDPAPAREPARTGRTCPAASTPILDSMVPDVPERSPQRASVHRRARTVRASRSATPHSGEGKEGTGVQVSRPTLAPAPSPRRGRLRSGLRLKLEGFARSRHERRLVPLLQLEQQTEARLPVRGALDL